MFVMVRSLQSKTIHVYANLHIQTFTFESGRKCGKIRRERVGGGGGGIKRGEEESFPPKLSADLSNCEMVTRPSTEQA